MRYLAFISYRHRDRDQLISGLFRKGQKEDEAEEPAPPTENGWYDE